jgi:hypothetical protein
MVAQFVAALERPISRVRLEAYRPTGTDDLTMIVNYFSNIELSEALYPTLQAFEIALRNSVHAALGRHFASEFWFDRPRLLQTRQQGSVLDARRELTKHGKPHDAGRIVAELNFGFWHSMFNRPFEAGLWHANRAALLAEVFPNLPRTLRTRLAIWNRCDQIRRLRNRVMHDEPIWARPRLLDEHAQILETLGWISSDMRTAIAMCDRFDDVFRSSRSRVGQRIKDHLGIT